MRQKSVIPAQPCIVPPERDTGRRPESRNAFESSWNHPLYMIDNLDHKTIPSILLTLDVEDWFQVENLRSAYPLSRGDQCELRVEANTRRILDLCDENKIKATFFVLGWLAERLPGLVREIYKRGHEVASHGYYHTLCREQKEKEIETNCGTARTFWRTSSATSFMVSGPHAFPTAMES